MVTYAKTDRKQERMLANLARAQERDRRNLEPFRAFSREARKQYAGRHYGPNAAEKPVPVNLVELYLNTYSRGLVANHPAVLIYTPHRDLKMQAAELELALNHLSREITLGDMIREVVMEALMGMAIMRVGMADGPQVEIGGVMHDVGQPFADPIPFDDWVHDTGARRPEQFSYCGYRQMLPLDYVMDSDLYTNKDCLTASSQGPFDESGEERANLIGRSNYSSHDDGFLDYVEVWEFYLPSEGGVGRMITVPVNHPGKIVRDYEWDGPERGPFHFLRYTPMPGQVMPVPPLSTVFDLHLSVNAMWRKLERQAKRLKRLGLFMRGNDRDAKNIKTSDDGDAVAVNSPRAQDFVEAQFGGVSQELMMFAMASEEKFSEMSGNLALQAGISPQSETIGQDQILAQAASRRMEDMQEQTVAFTQGVMESLGWWMWHDPTIRIPIVKQVPGVTNAAVAGVFSAEETEGDWLDYNFTVEPYSMTYQSPGQRLQTLMTWFTQVAMPSIPLYAEQGVAPDMIEFTRLFAKYSNTPEILDVMQLQGASDEGQRGPVEPGQEMPKPAQTTRTYERVNRAPGPTRQNRTRMMMDRMMGSNNGQNGSGNNGNGGGY